MVEEEDNAEVVVVVVVAEDDDDDEDEDEVEDKVEVEDCTDDCHSMECKRSRKLLPCSRKLKKYEVLMINASPAYNSGEKLWSNVSF